MNLTTRRRAIYTELTSHFAGDEPLAAVALWECKYAGMPFYFLDGFIAELVVSTERTIERATVYRDLMGALTGPAADFLPAPERLINAWRGSNQNEPSMALCRGMFCVHSKPWLPSYSSTWMLGR
ncbi:hypothetical protein WG219_16875 [Ectopseudomonas mendocina]|uniref:Uncharacterized protein n=1 Tax=Ectopseudomonas mendocina TaxID=300 RepID=A0ABZ2REC1_ECTME